jgi:aryl-alcohol dehydrogenase-like predicted oxidoreductase
MQLLGQIAILQLHKTTPELLNNPDVIQAFAYAQTLGIGRRGVSVSDAQSAALAMKDPRFPVMQFPYNRANTQYQEVVQNAEQHNKYLIINRPFQMGQVTASHDGDAQTAAVEAFRFILQEDFNGVVLTGTSNMAHLDENIAAFSRAQQG